MLRSLALVALFATSASAQVTVQVTPASAPPGVPILVTVINGSSATVSLPTSCVINSINETGCDDTLVAAFACLQVITPVAPGQMKSQNWDQTDNGGAQVAPGTYTVSVRIFDSAFAVTEFCVPFVITACNNATSVYGDGGAGAGGVKPKIGFRGAPAVGGQFALEVADGVGGAAGILLVGPTAGSTPVSFGTFLIHPAGPIITAPIALGGSAGVPSDGFAAIGILLPNTPSLVGASAVLQAVIADSQSSGGASHTNGLALTICP